jgi:PKD repeat protein
MKTIKTAIQLLIGLILAAALVACPQQQPPAETVFTKENAWQGELPADAEILNPDEFRRRVAAGELVVAQTEEKQIAALERQFQQDRAFLAALPSPSPWVRELLEAANAAAGYQGDLPFQTPGGPTLLEGLGTQLRNAVLITQAAQSAENALEDYRQTYSLLPEDLQSRAATPESLVGRSADQIRVELSKLDALLAGTQNLDNTRLEAAPTWATESSTAELSTQAIRPGQGRDEDSPCAAPSGLAARHWFPLKYFISPMKNQGMRGSCWAFAALGAVESRELVQNNNRVNLSEQFLINKVKQDWDSSDYSEGYKSTKALNTAADKRQVLPNEVDWTYNQSPNRPNVQDGKKEAYARACDPYGIGPNAGTCSETAHQSRRACSTFVFTVCSYARVNFGGPGVAASRALQLWANGQTFDLARYRLLLRQGHVLMASFNVYGGFSNAPAGVVSDYTTACGEKAGKACGGHAVQIVGFLSNEQMSTPRAPVNVGGGGYFIVKNSWGCGAGDGGYYYVPADYVQRLFTSLSVLQFDGRRSEAWRREQATPGGSIAPTITLTDEPRRSDLRVSTDLARFFRVTHPDARSVNLTVSAPGLGTIYDGPWSIAPDQLVPPSLPYTFTSVGRPTLTLTARRGTASAGTTLTLEVVNTPPSLSLVFSGQPRQGEAYPLSVQITDINEADPNQLCPNTTWSVDPPDTLSTTTGCHVNVTFGTTGDRTVRVSTRDTEGAVGRTSRILSVLPPPENPYPRITDSGMYSRELRRQPIIMCTNQSVANGATIDFREKGCNLSVLPDPPRFFAHVTVENPANESLTYTWILYRFDQNRQPQILNRRDGPDPTFEPYSVGNAIPVTEACYLTVQVNAPDPQRTKRTLVWSGNCTYYSTRLN